MLLLCDTEAPGMQNAILDHVAAFGAHSRHAIVPFNPRTVLSRKGFSLRGFDAVVIHFSLCALWDNYLPVPVRDEISAFQGLKVQFIQDEYRYADLMSDRIHELGIHVVFTLADDEARSLIYRHLIDDEVQFIRTATAYVPDYLIEASRTPIETRSIQLSYRAREVPYWWGALAQEKVSVAQALAAKLKSKGVRFDVDTSTAGRITGEAWVDFLKNSKSVLVTQSGTSITDYDGKVEKTVTSYLAEHPHASFEEVAKKVLAPYENNVRYVAPSPKILEAVSLGCALVMTAGEHGYGLRPGEHYFELNKDLSNAEELVEFLSSDEMMQQIADAAYMHVIASDAWTYRRMIREFDDIVVRNYLQISDAAQDRRLPPGSARVILGLGLRLRLAIDHQCARADLAARSFMGFVVGRIEIVRAYTMALSTPAFWALVRAGNVRWGHLLKDIATVRYGIRHTANTESRRFLGEVDAATGLLQLSIIDIAEESEGNDLADVSDWIAQGRVQGIHWENEGDWQKFPKPLRFSSVELNTLGRLAAASGKQVSRIFSH